MESPEIRVHWTVTLWGPRAADDPEHSISGSGSTPEAALEALQLRVESKKDLLHAFNAQAKSLD